jgi:Ser/Thr protein kinase RdoA (MazF antagonist)
MKDFDDLSNRGQQRRLRLLAETALAEYGLRRYSLRALLHRENTTFRVDVGAGPKTSRWVLRISKPTATAAAVHSELLWLRAIRRDSDLSVPEPVETRGGDLVVQVGHEAVPGTRVCALFGWIEGRFRQPKNFSRASIREVGRFMGHLHRHSQGFMPPADFVRPRLDYAGILGAAHGGSLETLQATTKEHRLLEIAATKVQQAMYELGEGSEVFGLIHADLHAQNYLFHRGRVGAIDFDACSFGHYLADIAATTHMLRHPRLDSADVLEEFLGGYCAVRELNAELRAKIDLFKVANSLMLAIWMTSRGDNPLLRGQAAEFIAHQLQQIKIHLV